MNTFRWLIGILYWKHTIGLCAVLCLLTGRQQLCGQAVQFPNAASSVNIGDLDVPGNQITAEALIYMEKNTVAGDVISKHLTPGNVNYLLRPLTFELTTSASGNGGPVQFLRLYNPVSLELNRWYHVAGTYDGKTAKYYVNGCLVAEKPFSGNLYQNNVVAAIGNKVPCECEQFSGKIDEVRIWKTARSQRDIARNMLSLPEPRNQPGLLAYYKFDGNYINSQGNLAWNGTKSGTAIFSSADANMQTFEITNLESANADCEKVTNGSITIFANRANAIFSIDNVQYQQANVFPALRTGDYMVYAKDPDGCMIKTPVTVGNNHAFVTVDLSASLCRETSYMGYAVAGTHTDTLAATTGCDTLRTVAISENLRSIVTTKHTICEGESYLGHQAAGKYADTLVAANGCDSINVLELTVASPPHPDLGGSRSICKGDSINLFPGKYNSYLWQDGSAKENFTVTSGGLYSVKVANACGVQLQQVLIKEGFCGLFFPTAFSPNGDGTNDQFRPAVYNLANFQWKIFNRVGQLIFETKENGKGWDGRVNGQLQSTGVYVWTCSYTKNNQTEVKKGTMVLIR